MESLIERWGGILQQRTARILALVPFLRDRVLHQHPTTPTVQSPLLCADTQEHRITPYHAEHKNVDVKRATRWRQRAMAVSTHGSSVWTEVEFGSEFSPTTWFGPKAISRAGLGETKATILPPHVAAPYSWFPSCGRCLLNVMVVYTKDLSPWNPSLAYCYD